MLDGSFLSFYRVFFQNKSLKLFLFAAVLGVAFSMSVVLATLGLMEGFELSLKSGLKNSSGDIILGNRSLNIQMDHTQLDKRIQQVNPRVRANILKSQAFIVKDENASGVLVKGVDAKDFNQFTSLNLKLELNSVAIGSVLARKLNLKVADQVVLIFSEARSAKSIPFEAVSLKVGQIIQHGVYEKDLRYLYIEREQLQKILRVKSFNEITLELPKDKQSISQVEAARDLLQETIGLDFSVKAYWDEFGGLLEAVEIEKYSIAIVLQLIVIVAIFNMAAFIFYILEKKSQEFFLLRTLGVSAKEIQFFWFKFVLYCWIIASLLALIFVAILKIGILDTGLIPIPGEIYFMEKLTLSLSLSDFIFVHSSSFIWLLGTSIFSMRKIKNKALLSSLRLEFA